MQLQHRNRCEILQCERSLMVHTVRSSFSLLTFIGGNKRKYADRQFTTQLKTAANTKKHYIIIK